MIVCVSIVRAPGVDMRWRGSYCRAKRVVTDTQQSADLGKVLVVVYNMRWSD